MPDYAVRITHSYEEIAQLVGAWAMRSETMAVYEHPKDAKVNRTHCHLVITGTNVDKKQLRNIASKFADVKGNENCSFKDFTGEETAYIYMTKGEHDPKYLLCIPEGKAVDWKARWKPREVYEKIDKNTKRYNEFVSSQCVFIDNEPTEEAKLFEVKKLSRYYVRVMLKLTLSIDAINVYKMLVRTYCYDNSISIPRGDKLEW